MQVLPTLPSPTMTSFIGIGYCDINYYIYMYMYNIDMDMDMAIDQSLIKMMYDQLEIDSIYFNTRISRGWLDDNSLKFPYSK